MIQSSPLAVDASFLFVDLRDLGAVDSLLKHTPHGVVNRVEVLWVRRPESRWDKMCYPLWIRCCKLPKYDFCISQGSVATVLRWDGQISSHLHQVSSWCCILKIIKIGQCVTELFKKWHWHGFFWDTVYTTGGQTLCALDSCLATCRVQSSCLVCQWLSGNTNDEQFELQLKTFLFWSYLITALCDYFVYVQPRNILTYLLTCTILECAYIQFAWFYTTIPQCHQMIHI